MSHKIRWRGKDLTTICTVTEAIKDTTNCDVGAEEDALDAIWRLADTAMNMGQAMEAGLNDKKAKIEDLHSQVATLESKNADYWAQIEQLQDEIAGYEEREEA